MARVTGALFSMDASGTIGDAITYAKWKGRQYARQWFIPQNPKTALQTNVRLAFSLLVAYWQSGAISQAGKDAYQVGADPLNMSGFDLYMRRGMDQYVIQLTTAVTPVSVTVEGNYPDDVFTWT